MYANKPPRASAQGLTALPFETIKARSIRLFQAALDAETAYVNAHGKGGSPAFLSVQPFVHAVAAERGLLRELILALEPRVRQTSAEQVQSNWSRLEQPLREAGLRRIRAWDIRLVGCLIALFPACVSKAFRLSALTCHIDDASGEWLISPETDHPPVQRGRCPSRA